MELKRNPDSLDPMFNYGSSSAGSAALDETSSEAITLSTAGDHTHKLNWAFSEISLIVTATLVNKEETKIEFARKEPP